jgi:O-antigen/teichoic acid export membrane protein
MTGTTIAQAIPIAISPILTRIYTPEDFGMFALYMSIASIFATIATGRYELAIMLPKKNEDAINIVFLSIAIAFIVSLISFIIIFIFNNQITTLLKNPKVSDWLYFIPLTVLLTGLYQSFNYWSNRQKQYRRLAISRVIQSSGTASTNLAMGFNGFTTSGLIAGSLVGQAIATSVLVKMVWKEDSKLLHHINCLKMFALLKKHKKLPLLNSPNALIDGVRLSGINILIAKYFTTATLGQFSLAWKMVQTPLGLLGGSLSQVFFQKVASAKKNELFNIVKKFIAKATLIAVPIFLIIFLFSVDIFTFIFGDDWSLAGRSASIMAPWLFLNFISSPLSTLFIVLNKQEIVLVFSIFYMLIPLSVIFIFRGIDFLEVLNIVTLCMSGMLIIFILLVIYYTKKEAYHD